MAPKVSSKLVPEAELDEIMMKAEALWQKLFKPKSSYICFTKTLFQKAKSGETGGCKKFSEMGKRWTELSAADKRPFEEMHEAEKVQAAEMQNNYDSYMQKVGPRLLDHDEEVERAELAARKNDVEKRYRLNQHNAKQERLARSKLRKGGTTARAPKAAKDVHEVLPKQTVQPMLTDTEKKLRSLSDGLDPKLWEVRESRTKPGMYYYFNKLEKVTQVSRPQVTSAGKRVRSNSAQLVSGKNPRRA